MGNKAKPCTSHPYTISIEHLHQFTHSDHASPPYFSLRRILPRRLVLRGQSVSSSRTLCRRAPRKPWLFWWFSHHWGVPGGSGGAPVQRWRVPILHGKAAVILWWVLWLKLYIYIYIATIVFDYDHYYYQNYYQYIAIRIILYIISYGYIYMIYSCGMLLDVLGLSERLLIMTNHDFSHWHCHLELFPNSWINSD